MCTCVCYFYVNELADNVFSDTPRYSDTDTVVLFPVTVAFGDIEPV